MEAKQSESQTVEKSRPYPSVTVTKKGERFLRGGHVWVYDAEIVNVNGTPCDGEITDVFSDKGKYLGSGFYNAHSKIRVRLLSSNANDRYDERFWERRVRYAVDYRRTVMSETEFTACRLIFGEADGFPGLTVDRFDDVLVTEVMCLGTEQRKGIIYGAVIRALAELGVTVRVLYERNEAELRRKEGLPCEKGFYAAPGLVTQDSGHVIICENGVRYDVDYINGQKTGFFLDQKFNRLAVSRIAEGKKVLDCFTHTGAFGLNAAKGGASSVISVDISQAALESAKHNAELSGLSDLVTYRCADVFDLLTEMHKNHTADFDLIILDPPAFTKSSATKENAYRGYKEINLKAMQLLPRGGYLATCSCSHFMTDEMFRKMLSDAAADAHVSLRQIEARQQGPDHPILWNVPETDYLKFYIFQIV